MAGVSMEIGTDEDPQHWHADINDDVSGRLNWLRAAVLGANDGIVSTAGVVMGVAGATSDSEAILIAGIAALVAGAISMAAGEFVSVSTQRDSERSILAMEAIELERMPETEMRELVLMYEEKGLSRETASKVAEELTAHDALAAHADVEFGIDPDALTNPWHAAWASMLAFTIGALLPLLVVVFVPPSVRIVVTVASVMAALALTGLVSAHLGYSPRLRAVLRTVTGGVLAMGITYLIGMAAGTQL
jgi:vacuolar iron transporter family protein